MHQRNEIASVERFIYRAKRQPFLLQIPWLQRYVFGPTFRVKGRGNYFSTVMKFLGRQPKQSYETYKKELLDNQALRRAYEEAVSKGKIPPKYPRYEDRVDNEANIVHFYALPREMAWQTVVETGTAAGSMTSWILAALEKNGSGKLISIDIPAVKDKLTMDLTVAKDQVGFLIPTDYRSRWQCIFGDAKIHLPKVLAENSVDAFIHDSLHTRTHMLFEYNAARALMKPGALILSDDILWNSSFFDFLKAHHLRGITSIANPNLGLAINTFDEYERSIGTDIIRS